MNLENEMIRIITWIMAPIITSVGFGLGIYLYNKVMKTEQDRLYRIIFWPFVGCSLGALLVYWYGPMLIVFAMLVGGTMSIAIREIVFHRNE